MYVFAEYISLTKTNVKCTKYRFPHNNFPVIAFFTRHKTPSQLQIRYKIASLKNKNKKSILKKFIQRDFAEYNQHLRIVLQNDVFIYSSHNPLVFAAAALAAMILIVVYFYIACMSWLIVHKLRDVRKMISAKTYDAHKRLLVALAIQVEIKRIG